MNLTQEPQLASGVVTLEPDSHVPKVFDGARVYESRSGIKLKFLKGEEFRGDRTLNVIPEIRPPEHTSFGNPNDHDLVASTFEHFAFQLYKQLGLLTPRAEWFRVISVPNVSGPRHTQRLVIQQVNERFLEMNGRDSDGDLYKHDLYAWEKKTNTDESLDRPADLIQRLSVDDPLERRRVMEEELDLPSMIQMSVADKLVSNIDGLLSLANYWLFFDPEKENRAEVIPWDLDCTFDWGIDSPLQPTGNPQVFPRLMFQDETFYSNYLRQVDTALSTIYTMDNTFAEIDSLKALRLGDLSLLEEETGETLTERREKITEACGRLKEFIQTRREFLAEDLARELGTAVRDWRIR